MTIVRGALTASLIAVLTAAPALADPGPANLRTQARLADTWSLTTPVTLGAVGENRQADLAITSDGLRALSLGNGGLSQINLAVTPGTVVGRAPGITGTALALRPGRRLAYVGDANDLKVVSIARAKPSLVRSLNDAFPSPISDLVVSPNGRWLYVSYTRHLIGAYGVRVYSLAKPARPRLVAQFRTEPGTWRLALNQAGTMLAVGHDLVGSVTLVRVTDPRHPVKLGGRILMPRKNSVSGMVFSPDGRRLFVVGSDEATVTTIGVAARGVIGNVDLSGVAAGGEAASIGRSGDGVWLFISFAGQFADNTVVAAHSSDITVDVTVNNLLYPRPLAVSPAGSTKDTAYFVSSPSLVLAQPAALYGLVRHPG